MHVVDIDQYFNYRGSNDDRSKLLLSLSRRGVSRVATLVEWRK